MFERPYLKSVKARIEEPRKFIQVVLGPRQVGKTTMVTQLLSQLSIVSLYESADAISATNSAWLMQVWESARLRLKITQATELKRLFELGCLYSGQILSYTKIIGQLQDAGNTTTLAKYLKLLSDCGLLGGLDKYAGDIIRKRSSSPKFQVYNNVLITYQSNDTYEKAIINSELWGRLVESSVGTHLINHSISERYNLYYWRDGNHEVDFVLEKGDKVIGLEVKSGMKAENAGMGVFAERFQPEKVLLVGTGGISYDEFLNINPKEFFIKKSLI